MAAALAAAEAEARDSGLEDEEGEGRWKPAAGAAPSTLASADRTRVGKVVGFFGRSVCPRVCVYLSRTVSEYRFFARCQSPRRANQYIQPYLTFRIFAVKGCKRTHSSSSIKLLNHLV